MSPMPSTPIPFCSPGTKPRMPTHINPAPQAITSYRLSKVLQSFIEISFIMVPVLCTLTPFIGRACGQRHCLVQTCRKLVHLGGRPPPHHRPNPNRFRDFSLVGPVFQGLCHVGSQARLAVGGDGGSHRDQSHHPFIEFHGLSISFPPL